MPTKADVDQLVAEVLLEDPIPFENVNLVSADAVAFVSNAIWERYVTEWAVVDKNATEAIMLAVLIKTIAENFYLHTKLLMLGEADA